MAYSTSNPPICHGNALGNGARVWTYHSTDAHTAVDATDYFSNGYDLGMKVDDIVIVRDTSTPTVTLHAVSAVTAGGAATIGASGA